MAKTKKEPVENRTLQYKIRMVVEIEGEIDAQRPLYDDTGIYPYIQWAADDIQEKLDAVCDIVDVLEVNLKDVGAACPKCGNYVSYGGSNNESKQ